MNNSILIYQNIIEKYPEVNRIFEKLKINVLVESSLEGLLLRCKESWPRVVLFYAPIPNFWLDRIRDEYVIRSKLLRIVCFYEDEAPTDLDLSVIPVDEYFLRSEVPKRLEPFLCSIYEIPPELVGGIENRKYRRVRAFGVVNIQFNSQVIEGEVVNLSEGGMLFSSSATFEKHDHLHLVIHPPQLPEFEVTLVVGESKDSKDALGEPVKLTRGHFKSIDSQIRLQIRNWMSTYEKTGERVLQTYQTLTPKSELTPDIATKLEVSKPTKRSSRERAFIAMAGVSALFVLAIQLNYVVSHFRQSLKAQDIASDLGISDFSVKEDYLCGKVQKAAWDSWDEKRKWAIGNSSISKMTHSTFKGLKILDERGDVLATTVNYGSSLMWVVSQPSEFSNSSSIIESTPLTDSKL